jgi:nucleoid-associated protein YgaU
VKATVAQRSDSRSDSTEHSLAGDEAGLRPATRPARRRRPARGAAGQAPRTQLRLVATDGRVLRPASAEPVRTTPAATPAPPQPAIAPQPAAAPRQPAVTRPAPTPVRLTRRGRLVITGMAVLLVAAVSVGLAGAAQALGHSATPARPGTPAITKVEVRPGQSLWTLAEAYDPNADTRQVIQEILQLNSLSTDQVQPGQVLWMPRD